MFKKFFVKSTIDSLESHNKHILERIAKMNLVDMRSYVKGSIKDLELNDFGLIEIMRRLTTKDHENSQYYLHSDDMDSKKKKAFELFLLVAKSKKVTIETVALLQEFVKLYEEIICDYDHEYKDIYKSRFDDAIAFALVTIESRAALKNKMNLLKDS